MDEKRAKTDENQILPYNELFKKPALLLIFVNRLGRQGYLKMFHRLRCVKKRRGLECPDQ